MIYMRITDQNLVENVKIVNKRQYTPYNGDFLFALYSRIHYNGRYGRQAIRH
jgi:hypothetical protein